MSVFEMTPERSTIIDNSIRAMLFRAGLDGDNDCFVHAVRGLLEIIDAAEIIAGDAEFVCEFRGGLPSECAARKPDGSLVLRTVIRSDGSLVRLSEDGES